MRVQIRYPLLGMEQVDLLRDRGEGGVEGTADADRDILEEEVGHFHDVHVNRSHILHPFGGV